MGWERRQRGTLYYTRSRKVGGRVVREYVGSGYVAQLAAQLDEIERIERQERDAAWRRERDRLEALDAKVLDAWNAVESVLRATLLAHGFHRHNRGEWRHRRGS